MPEPLNPNIPNQSRSQYYASCRAAALAKRQEHSVVTEKLNLSVMARIYKAEGITLDRRKLKNTRIKATYMTDDAGTSVLINTALPREPRLFALAHELKHHIFDREKILGGQIKCGNYNANELIEKAGEVFAAEFIYPEDEMRKLLGELGITTTNLTAESVVKIKRHCRACVSYMFILKRLSRFSLCSADTFAGVKFTKLEEELFGPPVYKRSSFIQARLRKRSAITSNF